MIGIKYFKADSSTYVLKTAGGKVCKQGKGLSFFLQCFNNFGCRYTGKRPGGAVYLYSPDL